ncbi:hypothetical protein [Agromyces sp. H66]|uniref:hypothetical protein n=1 Tax=Agromyces sp. H66 TaxID=2529859 RepID=UPI0010AAFDF8|nr:hypothetical protein [Agromyces sp. H66]
MNRIWRLVIFVASFLVDAESRARHREQWLADLEGAAEADIAPSGVAFGALRTVPSINPTRGASMPIKPIGPLAIALKHTNPGRRQVAVIAVLAATLLAVGIVLLVV